MEYDNIILTKTNNEGFRFGFKNLETEAYPLDCNSETLEKCSIEISCSDREHNLIDGLTHEITEATIIDVLARLKFHEMWIFKIQLPHYLTVISLKLYSVQFKYMLRYESFFKDAVKRGKM